MVIAAAELAEEALRLVGVDPLHAAAAAEQAVAAAREGKDRGAESTARRAWGLAAAALREPEQAVAQLRRAVRCADRAGLARHAAQARMSLAFALLGRGQISAALAAAERASAGLGGVDAARLEAQRATVLVGAGRLDEALEGFRRALPALRRAGDVLWEARILNNRGVLHARRDAFTAAERDLLRAESLYRQLGRAQDASEARWNLGYTAARRGDVPAALTHYDQFERQQDQAGLPSSALYRDRAELLLSVGLLEEAREQAARAVHELAARGLSADLAEAQLVSAQIALVIGDADAAADFARDALRSFTTQGRASFAALARHAGLRAAAVQAPTPARLAEAVVTAEVLRSAGFLGAALDAELVAGQIAVRLGRITDARHHLAAAASMRDRGSVQLRVRAWYAEALCRLTYDRPAGAESALRASMRIVDDYRATLGATELRVGVSTHAREVAGLGLRMAVERGDAVGVLRWVERWRAAALRLPPVRPPAKDELGAALRQLRAADRDLEGVLLAGGPAAQPRRRLRAVEEEVRRQIRRNRTTAVSRLDRPASVARLRTALGERVLVEYVEHDGTLLAVLVGAGSRPRLVRLAERAAVEFSLEALRFALRRMATGRGSAAAVASAVRTMRHCAGEIDNALLAPLRSWLGEKELVVVPTGLLHSIPWGVLPSRVGKATTVAPSATMWLRGAEDRHSSAGEQLFVAGPGLPAAAQEVAQLAVHYDHPAVLTGAAATVDEVLRHLPTARSAHVACHARYRADNPLFSHLELADGPLTVYELESAERTPELVVLSACQSGVASIRAGDEVLGLATALLPRGTRTLVATLAPVADEATCVLMCRFHEELRAGRPPALALALAQDDLMTDEPVRLATAAAYVCVGQG